MTEQQMEIALKIHEARWLARQTPEFRTGYWLGNIIGKWARRLYDARKQRKQDEWPEYIELKEKL